MKKFWPYIFLFCVVTVIAITNYTPGTILTGWDNLHPEFSPFLNLKRTFFSAWLEYRGVGLADGMAQGTDLIRQLILFPFYWILGTTTVRFFYTISTLFIGAAGMYTLCHYLLSQTKKPLYVTLAALLGGLFYIFNLATLQQYTVPFEVFTTHFAMLPWLLLTASLYLQKQNKKTLFYLILTLVLATPGAYVPTLFIVYCMAVGILALFLKNPFQGKQRIQNLRHISLLFLIIFCVNAFWILPFSYFTITSAQVNVNAKINQMSTQNIFELNKEFGTIPDATLLKGFLFHTTEPSSTGTYEFLLKPWITHLQNPLVICIGYLFFITILAAIIISIRKKEHMLFGYCAIWLFSMTMLLAATPPFSFIDALLRDHIPLFGQVFRFPDTKFSILAALCFAIFFAYGIQLGITLFNRYNTYAKQLLFGLFFTLLIIFMFPVFTGNLFSKQEKLAIPTEYFNLFSFFNTQDPNTRIADFPQPGFWGWQYYKWGYSGSGFIWFGLPQPILHRAFDVWSPFSENYYFELAQAVYSKDQNLFANILEKYQINWLIVDKNLRNPSSPKALFVPELEAMIQQNPQITKVKTFGNIDVYHVNVQTKPHTFVFGMKHATSVQPYTWSNLDTAYTTRGNYISSPNPEINYPFQSLFSLKTTKEKDFTQLLTPSTIIFAKIISIDKDSTIVFPKLSSFIYAQIQTTRTTTNTEVTLVLQTPTIRVNSQTYSYNQEPEKIFSFPNTDKKAALNINGNTTYTIEKKSNTMVTTLLSLTQDNIITLEDPSGKIQVFTIKASDLANKNFLKEQTIPLTKGTSILYVTIPRINDTKLSFSSNASVYKNAVTNCDVFRTGVFTTSLKKDADNALLMSTENNSTCLSAYLPDLSHRFGYAVFINTHHITGRGLHFWIENVDEHYVPLDTILSDEKTPAVNSFVLAPQDTYGNAYSLHLENVSVLGPTQNSISDISMYPIPYEYLTQLYLRKPATNLEIKKPSIITPTSVKHPNESLYIIHGIHSPQTLVLSQAFNPGWVAYTFSSQSVMPDMIRNFFPFFFGQKLDDHVMVNNWENGWNLSSQLSPSDTIIIVYLPQYLQYLGLIASSLILIVSVYSLRKSSHTTP